MSARARSARNLFTAVPLDRSSEWRDRVGRGELGEGEPVAFYLSARGEVLVDAARHLHYLATSSASAGQVFFLGGHEGRPVLAHIADDADRQALLSEERSWIDLRLAAATLPALEAGFAAYARALLHWHDRHRHCGACGHPTTIEAGGHRRRCSNSGCALEHFPRLDPAIIVLVEFEGRCLLGRQANWPPKRYSVLAGFVEPGESLEDALVREVAEESGVQVTDCDYHSSQPWPFPSSLMLGFRAVAAASDLQYGGELEHAAWYSAEEMLAAVQAGELKLPPRVSLSSRLIEDWYEERTGASAEELFGRW